MMRRKEMKQLLEERADRIGLLEQRLETAEQLIDGYKSREGAIVEALNSANEAAKRRVEDAQQRALQIGRTAEARASEVEQAARQQAESTVAAARAESERLLNQTNEQVRAYETALKQYNANLERSAAEAEAIAARYAAFLKERKTDQGELLNDAGAGIVTAKVGAVDLPDPSDSPAKLMQNIYKLQNRDIPDSAQQTPEEAAAGLIDEIIADLGPRPADGNEPAAPETAKPAAAPEQPAVLQQPVAPAAQPQEAFYAPVAAQAPVITPPQPVAPAAQPQEAFYAPVAAQAPVTAPEQPAAPAALVQEAPSMTHPAPKPAASPEPAVAQEMEYGWQSSDEDGDVPSVSELLPDSMPGDDLSLDALLDEIISAGNI